MGVGPAAHGDAAAFKLSLQKIAGRGVELTLHQVRREMKDRDLHAAEPEPRRRLEPEKPAADHHGAAVLLRGRLDQRLGVVEIAIGDDARQIVARHRDHEGRGPGGDDQLVKGRLARGADDDLAVAVDALDRLAEAAVDAVRLVPVSVMGDDLGVALLARKHGRKHDPVVVAARLGVEQRHVERVGRGLEQVLKHPAGGHAGADDDQFLGHGCHSAANSAAGWAAAVISVEMKS